ncbi:hypothetical protein [Candidatus Methylomirabilis sp.]|uniref:hypothetical protein n=1 Tax=Candidatus Methylomirabilis sp. TaxID=2032687 RepID=UPI003076851A
MSASLRELSRIITVKPEPETTPSLPQLIQKDKACQTVSQYYFTPSLRSHFKKVFECVINRKGQGFWVQAEYGAGKTHFLGALMDLLVWPESWTSLADEEIRKDYAGALSKTKLFPVAFSLRGMGESSETDSLMRIFEEQIRESIAAFAPTIKDKVLLTSPEIADNWYAKDTTEPEKAGVRFHFEQEHKCSPEQFRSKYGVKKFGQELVRSKLPEGRLRGKFKERFSLIYEQITKLGGYDGIVFVIDEFRSWQDRHIPGTAAYAEDEEILETLAYVLPTQHHNILTVIASQGDMPQKLSGGGEGDRFIPLYLLSGKDKDDFGRIVSFRCRDLLKGAGTDIKDYYDYCRKEYRFIKQFNISLDYFTAIFPFQPRCFDVLRRLTQNAEKHNLPTARSAIRMAWQVLSEPQQLKTKRLMVLSDLIRTDELQKGLNHEHYRDGYQNLQAAIDQLPDLSLAEDESAHARHILETLFLWAVSLPDNQRDGLTPQEVAEASWLSDDAIGATALADQLLNKLVQSGFPIRQEKKTKDSKEVTVYSYETTAAQANPVRLFAPLKKKAKEDVKGQDAKWIESLFWQLPDITPEAQAELGVNGGILYTFQPPDPRTFQDRQEGKPPAYQFPHRSGASTRQVHKVQYTGEVVVANVWRDEFGEEIKNVDQHFRLVYMATLPDKNDDAITGALKDARVAVCRPTALSEETRDALADMIAAEQMKRNCQAPSQSTLREYAEGKRRDAVKAILKCQQDEFRRGKIITQKSYAIPALEVFKSAKDREEDLAGRLLEKSYDTPLFTAKELKKEFTDADARKLYGGLFGKEPAKAEKDAILNFGVGMELVVKSHPTEFKPDSSQALAKIREHIEGRDEVPVSDIKSSFCRAPYALTEAMVTLYLLSLVRTGGHEIAVNPNAKVELVNGKPLPGNRLTAHTLTLCEWNAKLDKAMLGARLVLSVRKGWNDVLPYARMLDDTLKPAKTPDEELERNTQLLAVLAKLKVEIPEVEKGTDGLAAKLGGTVPKPMSVVFARLTGLTASSSYQEFDAAVRESYATKDAFADAHAQYEKARRLRDRAFEVGEAYDYLSGACAIDAAVEFDRNSLIALITFDNLLDNPSLISARIDGFEQWKRRYVHAYRKAHRDYYDGLNAIAKRIEALRPRVIAMNRLNSILELGPPPASTVNAGSDLKQLESATWVCLDAAEPDVAGSHALCHKCRWTLQCVLPQKDYERLDQSVSQGLADRIQRLRDTSIAVILKKAADDSRRADLTHLIEIIQIANADKLVEVITDDLVAFLRRLLQEANIVQESVELGPIIRQIGAIEEDRVDEAMSKLTALLTKAVKDAKAKHGPSKRVRVFLRIDAGEHGGHA